MSPGSTSLPVLLVNAAVLTAEGAFSHRRLTRAEARDLVRTLPWVSAIGHPATARLVSMELGIHCPMRRIEVQQAIGQRALVFRLNRRSALGVDQDEPALHRIGHHWSLIERTA